MTFKIIIEQGEDTHFNLTIEKADGTKSHSYLGKTIDEAILLVLPQLYLLKARVGSMEPQDIKFFSERFREYLKLFDDEMAWFIKNMYKSEDN